MIDHPYRELLAHVERPGRYLGGEFGAVTPRRGDLTRFALAFPDVYEVGTSHVGSAVLYELLAGIEGVSVERVFSPWPDMERLLLERDLPLVSLESARPLAEFDLIGISLQYELNYTNAIRLFDLGRVPRRASERRASDPIVLLGGPLAAHCEPLAPFADLALVGDGEAALPELLAVFAEERRRGSSRERSVERCAELPSVFSPASLPRRVDRSSGRVVVDSAPAETVARRATVDDLDRCPPGAGPVPSVEAIFDRYSLEIARGCTEGCRFCQAGFLYRPVRERSEEAALAAVERAVSRLGHDEVSIAALSAADYSRLPDLLHRLGERFTPRRVSFSVPSLRAYGLPAETVEVLGRLRASGVTLAPEAGTQRLRDVINKNVDEEELLAAAARFFDRGFARIKLYFMIGLPGETDEDLAAIAALTDRVRACGRRRLGGRQPAVVASVSTFVPKPFTPLQREPMIGIEEIRRRQALLREEAHRRRIELRMHDPRLSRLEALLARGDARLADVLESAVDRGARFDGWSEHFSESAWKEPLAEIDVDSYLAEIDDGAVLPWDHVDVGVSAEFLREERDRARRGLGTSPCGRFRSPNGAARTVCHACGLGCDLDSLPVRDEREAPAAPPEPPPRRGARRRPEAPPRRGGAELERFRLTIARWGRQAYLGHLDAMRHVARGLRRAGLEVDYSRGFHPKPRIEPAPALPLATASLGEPIDVWLLDPPGEAELLERLRRALPFGMEAVEARRLAPDARKLSKAISGAEYLALVPVSAEELERVAERLLAADRFELVRRRRGRPERRFDARPLVRDARVLQGRPSALPLPEDAGGSWLWLSLELPGSGGVRPRELLEALLGEPGAAAKLIRSRVETS